MRLMLHLNYIAPVFVYFLQCGFQNFEYTHTHTLSLTGLLCLQNVFVSI